MYPLSACPGHYHLILLPILCNSIAFGCHIKVDDDEPSTANDCDNGIVPPMEGFAEHAAIKIIFLFLQMTWCNSILFLFCQFFYCWHNIFYSYATGSAGIATTDCTGQWRRVHVVKTNSRQTFSTCIKQRWLDWVEDSRCCCCPYNNRGSLESVRDSW